MGLVDSFPKETLEKIDVFAGDIRNPNGVRKAMQGIDTVFHLVEFIDMPMPYSYHLQVDYFNA